MTTLPFARQLVAVVATFLVSTACIVGAVGPAASHGNSSTTVVGRTLA